MVDRYSHPRIEAKLTAMHAFDLIPQEGAKGFQRGYVTSLNTNNDALEVLSDLTPKRNGRRVRI